MKIISTIGVLVFRNNFKEVLLVKHGEEAGHPTGIYGLPAGRIDDGETAAEASKRELNEETGLETTQENLVELPYDSGVVKLQRKNGIIFCRWKVFICNNFSGEIRGAGQETTPEWVKVSGLSKYWLLTNTKTAIEKGIKFSGGDKA